MTAGVANITIEQGAVFSQEYQYLQSDGVTPNDITSAYIAMQIRQTAGAATAEVTATTANGKVTITDAANGTFRIDLTPTDTSAVTVSGVYDIELSAGGDTSTTVRLVQGRAVLSKEVTLV